MILSNWFFSELVSIGSVYWFCPSRQSPVAHVTKQNWGRRKNGEKMKMGKVKLKKKNEDAYRVSRNVAPFITEIQGEADEACVCKIPSTFDVRSACGPSWNSVGSYPCRILFLPFLFEFHTSWERAFDVIVIHPEMRASWALHSPSFFFLARRFARHVRQMSNYGASCTVQRLPVEKG